MPAFSYVAVDEQGRTRRGVIEQLSLAIEPGEKMYLPPEERVRVW